ncbi:hypothetical protein ACUNV4_23605 [Granulosicoccus sp. 3-233]|uniref:hypothetical protein n=1 Tax=Granulosicoccus sp. 3-233 TaxID=3417969 RepID=UPI003D3548AF
MNPTVIKSGLLASVLAISGCASLSPPVRPDYTGADQVNTAEASQLVGVWRITPLNPYPDAEPQETTIEYLADGTVVGESIPGGESAAVLGDARFTFRGTWSLEGDTVVHEDVQMSTTGGNAMASMMTRLIGSRQDISGSANIYELTADRIVMVGDDGNATEYVRQ